MKKLIILCFLIISNLYAISRIVDINGSMAYTSINSAINEAVNGDTILVYPGHYIENVDFMGKSLILKSLYEQTGNDTLIYRTVIDGNYSGSSVKIMESVNSEISGFRIINGSGCPDWYMSGGGLIAKDSNLRLLKCIIEENNAFAGGGVTIVNGHIDLFGNSIKNNKALRGGGLCISGCTANFSETERNSVYNNDASYGSDILFAYLDNVIAYLDTFTVAIPSYYYFRGDRYGQVLPLHGVLEPIETDVYVAPWGDDNNSGLSAEAPFKTIKQANRMIYGDSLHIRTIHIAEGIYSSSTNGEELPLNVQGYVHWQGAGKNITIIDGEDLYPIILITNWQKSGYFKISSMTCKNSFFAETSQSTNFSLGGYVEISKVNFDSFKSSPTFLIDAVEIRATNAKIENCEFKNTQYGYGLMITNDSEIDNPNDMKVEIINCKINNNVYDPEEDPYWAHGGGVTLSGNGSGKYEDFSMINCEVTENANGHVSGQMGGFSGITSIYADYIKLINCTVSKNKHRQHLGCAVGLSGGRTDIINTIIYKNEAKEFSCNPETQIYIKNSIIGEGLASDIYNPNNNIIWETPNFIQNPMFDSLNTNYPFSLQANSPCINAGTLSFPEGVSLPEFDLAGNPRINEGVVDIGAYEYQGTPIIEEEVPEIIQYKLNVYPNPFKNKVNINISCAKEGSTDIAIYNIKGQKVNSLFTGFIANGKYNFSWDGKNEEGKSVASGQYILKFKQKDKEIIRKMMYLK